ncbi:MAG: hypothetical protein GQ535_05440 [Rhodobacteraceae bacterium]|nr:hypothetical protein [Paracoccaceae bacterium]
MPAYAQDVFRSDSFLEWPEESRSFYIRTSIGMAGFIASENSTEHADCLEHWYFDDEQASEVYIYGIMEQYPEVHPRAIIVAILQNKCGPFQYTEQAN